jgi:hypothetical protein
MPRPTWDPTRPLDSDQVSAFPSLHRSDKTTLKDIIGTLGPFGATTTTWRQVQIGNDTWLVQNLYFDGTNWNRDDTTKASVALGLRANGTVTVHKVAAGANPVGASLPAPVATLDATSLFNVLVAGTDPGGTEVLRAQNLRAGGASFADMFSNTVVAGTDPGGTESLRAGSARLNAPVLLGSVPQFTMAADPTAALQVATKQYADTKLARGTAETITAQHTFNPSTAGAPFLLGTNASGQLVTGLNADQVDGQHLADLDTRFVNAAGDSMSGALVVGTDPGGTELLRAQSLRAGSGRVGSWRILGVINVTAATTSIQFAGLNISPPAVLRLHYVLTNPSGSLASYQLRVNGEPDSLDWAFQYLTHSDTSSVTGRLLDSSEIISVPAGRPASAHTSICITGGGLVTAYTGAGRSAGADAPQIVSWATMKNTPITNLSSVEIVASVANAIGAGSVFMLEYLAP